MTEEIGFEEEDKPRPGFLTTLCVLSLVSIGFSLLSGVYSIIQGKASSEELFEQKLAFAEAKKAMRQAGTDMAWMYDQLEAMTLQINDNFYLASFIGFLTAFIGLAGVIMMMKGRKIGFHIYIIYSLIAIGGMYLYLSPANIPIYLTVISAIFSGLFILLYSRNLHWMKA